MLKSFLTASLVAIGSIVATLPAHALSLSTTFSGDRGNSGAMFDATTFGNSLKVTGIEINESPFSFFGSDFLAVYIKSGTYVGFETNSAAWTNVSGSGAISSLNNSGTPSPIDIIDFTLPASSVTGIYVTFGGRNSLATTNGTRTFANADLQLDLGVGKGGFFGATDASRTWNGTIIYDVIPVPFEFSPALGIAVFGGLFAAKKLSSKYFKK
jgi:hypothetical protein